ncbi:alpha/beta fold hydrolase [Fredinandcohnia sp. 179-A 10B2 NHS]|uniref:alpha/beta fold hydrolase n=1 Tax=Fredinandcohnia sp. 179-A 10B2 NHS TaxID=3235176 RepID=UPI0039A2AD34
MEMQPAKKFKTKKLMIRLLVSFIILLVSVCSFSYFYNMFATQQSTKKYPPVGEIVNVGKYNLHYYAVGEKNGLPTIVLESGSGTPSSYSDWRYIQPELAKLTRVISYDRAGYGWSDDANISRTSEQIVEDLHELLLKSDETGPFILVGHSFGGLNVQLFAERYSSDVRGVVLLDSSIPGVRPDVTSSQLKVTQFLRQSGLMRVIGEFEGLPVPKAVVSDGISEEFLYKRFYNKDQISEIEKMGVEDFPEISLGDIPVTIISAREEETNNKEWQRQQDQFLQLSTNSKRVIVENSSHYIHHDQPELVIKEIKNLLIDPKQ